MGKSYVENSLKRFLKRKVKITLGLVVAFMITGAVSFRADNVFDDENKVTAEKWLAGHKNGNKVSNLNGKFSIENGKIKIEGKEIADINSLELSNEVLENLTAMTGLLDKNINGNDKSNIKVNEDAEGFKEGFNLTAGEGVNINSGVLTVSQTKADKMINKGIIDTSFIGQDIDTGSVGYNYGIINAGTTGQNIKGTGYNYGVITTSKERGQLVSSNAKGYNYGIISATQEGQRIDGKDSIIYNYGIISSKGEAAQNVVGKTYLDSTAYNYGILENNTNGRGQKVASLGGTGYNYGIIRNNKYEGQFVENSGSKIFNYGLIENNTNDSHGQGIHGNGGYSYNYGIIRNTKVAIAGITDTSKGQAYNYGVIDFINTKETEIFRNNVENKGIVISNTTGLKLGTGENKGVVLDSSFKLTANANENTHVTDLATGTIDGAENKTYYTHTNTKDAPKKFDKDLTNNVLTSVITAENGTAFKYNGENLTLTDTTIVGYFEKQGTLLEVEKSLILKNSIINAVSDISKENPINATAVKLNGGKLTVAGTSEVVGKIVGAGTMEYVSINKAQNLDINGNITLINDDGTYGLSKTNTEVTFNTIKSDNLNLDFTVNTNTDINKITLNNAELKSIDGSSSTEKIELTVDSTENIGNINLGQNDDKFTVTNSSHNGIIDMGTGNDEFNVSMGVVDTNNHHKEAGNTFDYKVNGAEKIVLNGKGWHIGENAELNGGTTEKAGEKTELHIADKGSLHVDMNNNYGKGNVTTSLDKMAGEADLSVTTGKEAEVKFVVGDKFNVSEKQFDVATNYDVEKANVTSAVIFKTEKVNGKDIRLTVKDATEYNEQLDDYKSVYDAMLGALSSSPDLKDAVNYSTENKLVGMIKGAGNTAEAFYTTGYAVTKDVTDTYMSVVDDFGIKAGKGEWIAYGKYVNSDTEFDGGKASKGYDGDITGTVGMLEYGVDETTSYGVVYGQGDTKVDIQGGGKLEGDNTYFGGYVKHRTQGGFDLTGNVGYTKSELDLNLATSSGIYNMITSGKSDADALTFALKGKKDYFVTDTVKLQPVFGARYTLVTQDAVESSDANFRMDEQDVTIFEGMFGGNAVKEFDLYNGKLSLSVGAEYVLADVSKSDDARYTLYGKDIALTGEEDIADSRIEGHIGIDYKHESGVGVDAKYEMIWTDKVDNSRVTAGVSYRF